MSSFEQLVNQNVNLRKALNLARLGMQKAQADYNNLKEIYQSLSLNFHKLTNEFDRLQKSSQSSLAERLDTERFLESKIQQLKQAVETKQNEIEEIQLKIIPNLDQDMIRVKLINEMEEPYQNTILKKDQEIAEVRRKLTEVQRKLSLITLQYEECKLQKQQELDDNKIFYEGEIARLNTKLDCLVMGGQAREKDRQVIRKLRKDLEEARAIMQIKQDEAEELRREKDALRQQKHQILIKLSSKNTNQQSQKAINQVQLFKITEQIKSKDNELQNIEKELSKEKQQRRKLQRLIQQITSQRDQSKDQYSRLSSNIQDLQQKIKRVQDQRDQNQTFLKKVQRNYEQISQKLIQKQKQIVFMKQKHIISKESHEYDYSDKMQQFSNKKNKQKMDKMQSEYKQIIQSLRREIRQLKQNIEKNGNRQELEQIQNTKPSRPRPRPSPSPDEFNETQSQDVKILQQKIKILKSKLKQANNKIVQLLKQKISSQSGGVHQNDIDLSQTIPAYEARDAALVPLLPVPPPLPEVNVPIPIRLPCIPPPMHPESLRPIFASPPMFTERLSPISMFRPL